MNLPVDTDLKDLLEDCYDFAIGPMIAILPEEFEDESVANRIETLIQNEAPLDEFEKAVSQAVSPEALEKGKQQILQELEEWLSD